MNSEPNPTDPNSLLIDINEAGKPKPVDSKVGPESPSSGLIFDLFGIKFDGGKANASKKKYRNHISPPPNHLKLKIVSNNVR